jgi:gamma-polyglutamate biosynthesis protein CapA
MLHATFSGKRHRTFVATVLVVASFVLTFSYLEKYGETPARVLSPSIAEAVLTKKSTRLLFLGDIMLDRTIRTQIERDGGGALFIHVKPLFATADLLVGNLEGPITEHHSVSLGSRVGEPENTRFTFPPSTALLLRDAGFTLVSLGNNHMADFGRSGVLSTRVYLESAGVAFVGDPFDSENILVWQEVEGIRIAFVGYNEFIVPDREGARRAIGRARKEGADFVIVLAHWGEEYATTPPPPVRQLAATFAAAGANLIIGTHSHVRGEVEDIGETRVYYSLGNFVFDQYWDVSVRCGLAVAVELTKRAGETVPLYRTHETYLERDGTTSLGCPHT